MNKLNIKQVNKISSKISSNKGFTLLEIAIVLIVGTLILFVAGSIYGQLLKMHHRQERVMMVERALMDTSTELERALTTLPGRGLAVATESFSLPTLPSAGSAINPTSGKVEPIKLGVVTPYKVNGYDAVTIVYADSKIPRLTIGQNTTVSGSVGKARVSVENLINSPIEPIKDSLPSSTNSTPNRFPTPIPTGNNDLNNGNSVVIDLPLQPAINMFKQGDLMLLVGVEPLSRTTRYNYLNQTNVQSRIVKLLSVLPITLTVSGETRQFLEFTYDLCLQGDCDNQQLPGVSNLADAPKSVGFGGVLVPVRVSSIYAKPLGNGIELIRNNGGVILPNGDGSFSVRGGIETGLGTLDSFTISYTLTDDSTQPTPSSPQVAWLKEVKAVDILLVRGMKVKTGTNENLTHQARVSFPVVVNSIE